MCRTIWGLSILSWMNLYVKTWTSQTVTVHLVLTICKSHHNLSFLLLSDCPGPSQNLGLGFIFCGHKLYSLVEYCTFVCGVLGLWPPYKDYTPSSFFVNFVSKNFLWHQKNIPLPYHDNIISRNLSRLFIMTWSVIISGFGWVLFKSWLVHVFLPLQLLLWIEAVVFVNFWWISPLERTWVHLIVTSLFVFVFSSIFTDPVGMMII